MWSVLYAESCFTDTKERKVEALIIHILTMRQFSPRSYGSVVWNNARAAFSVFFADGLEQPEINLSDNKDVNVKLFFEVDKLDAK